MADLAFALFLANAASAVLVAAVCFARGAGYVTFPFLASCTFLGWYLPQAWVLLDDPSLGSGSLARLLAMSLLCFWAMVLGWTVGLGTRWRRPLPLFLPEPRLVPPVALITALAWTMTVLIEMQPAAQRAASQWSGPLTILHFFASVGVVSLMLSTALVLQRRSAATLTLFVLNAALYLPDILVYFRRADVFEFVLALLLGLVFVRGAIVPRAILAAAAVAGFLFVHGVGELRALGGGYRLTEAGQLAPRLPRQAEIAAIDWAGALDHGARRDISEVRNAAVFLDTVELTASLSLGAQFWNRLVLSYVPGQIVGWEAKRGLLIGTDLTTLAAAHLGHRRQTGTTWTGFVDPYRDFWYFGAAVFWATGFAMGRAMRLAARGSVTAYALYGSTLSLALHAITHFGYYLFSQSLLIVLAVLFVRGWLRSAPAQRRAVA